MENLDKIDRQILSVVQEDARKVSEDIAAIVGLSPAAVQRRLKRLRDSGAVEREIAVLSPRVVGKQMTFLVAVELERERADMVDAFRQEMRAAREVQQCYYVTGNADFLLIVLTKDMHDFEAFTRRVLFDNTNVRRFHTSVVMDRVKVGLSIPLEA